MSRKPGLIVLASGAVETPYGTFIVTTGTLILPEQAQREQPHALFSIPAGTIITAHPADFGAPPIRIRLRRGMTFADSDVVDYGPNERGDVSLCIRAQPATGFRYVTARANEVRKLA